MRIGLGIGLPGRSQPATFSYAQALAQLVGRGDTLALPGVGTINGFDPRNYIESTGPTQAPADGIVGLALDAGGAASSAQTLSAWSSTGATLSVVTGWQRGTSTAATAFISVSFTSVIGETYRVSGLLRSSAGSWRYYIGTSNGGNQVYQGAIGANLDIFVTATATTTYISARASGLTVGDYVETKDVQALRIPGIHFRQATTANKPVLKLVSGLYRWEFDGTDALSATIPAGYESCTIIDAAPGGQVTTTGQNIVGTYGIGPSLNTYGRIIARASLTGPELVLYQQLANKLAGL